MCPDVFAVFRGNKAPALGQYSRHIFDRFCRLAVGRAGLPYRRQWVNLQLFWIFGSAWFYQQKPKAVIDRDCYHRFLRGFDFRGITRKNRGFLGVSFIRCVGWWGIRVSGEMRIGRYLIPVNVVLLGEQEKFDWAAQSGIWAEDGAVG